MSFSEKPKMRAKMRVGELLAGTFSELASIPVPLLIYIAVFFLLGILQTSAGNLSGLASLTAMFLYFVGQYALYRILLRRAKMIEIDGPFRVFRFIGMALLLSIPIFIGFNFFLLPAVFLVAKWVMAPAYLVAGKKGVIESIGNSWSTSDGSSFSLSLVVFLLAIVFAIVILLAALLDEFVGIGSSTIPLVVVAVLHAYPLLLMGLSITAYRGLNQEPERLGDVFS